MLLFCRKNGLLANDDLIPFLCCSYLISLCNDSFYAPAQLILSSPSLIMESSFLKLTPSLWNLAFSIGVEKLRICVLLHTYVIRDDSIIYMKMASFSFLLNHLLWSPFYITKLWTCLELNDFPNLT